MPHAFADSMSCTLNILASAALDSSHHDSSKRKRLRGDEPRSDVENRSTRESHFQHQRGWYDENDPMMMAPDDQDTIPTTYKQGFMPFHKDPSARKTDRRNRSSYESICNDFSEGAIPAISFPEDDQNSKGFHVPSDKPGSRKYDDTYATDSFNPRCLTDEPSAFLIRPRARYTHPPSSSSEGGHHPSSSSKGGQLPTDSHVEHNPESDHPSAAWNSRMGYAYSSSPDESAAYGSQAARVPYYATPAHSQSRSNGPSTWQADEELRELSRQAAQKQPADKEESCPLATDKTTQDASDDTPDTHAASSLIPTYMSHPVLSDSYAREQMRRHSMMMSRRPDEPPRASVPGSKNVKAKACVIETKFHNKDASSFEGGGTRMVRVRREYQVPKKIVFVNETGQKKRKQDCNRFLIYSNGKKHVN